MKTATLRAKIRRAFFAIIIFLGVTIALLGFYGVEKFILGRTQEQVRSYLKTVHTVFYWELKMMNAAFDFLDAQDKPEIVKKKLNLDYLYIVPRERLADIPSEIVKAALEQKKPVSAVRLIASEELKKMNGKLYEDKIRIPVKPTPKAQASTRKELDEAMAFECAVPLFDGDGASSGVIYGGKILNRNFTFINKVNDAVFERKLYDGKPIGTVTVFLDDVRIATNVLDAEGHRAIGTRVSAEVYEKVVGRGEKWLDRAFVVTDWYLTAYEPIKDMRGKTIGILYVGILEKPFFLLRRNILFVFLGVILIASLLASGLSYLLASSIVRPISVLNRMIKKLHDGEEHTPLEVEASVKELDGLVGSFNDMAAKLAERERSLEVSNEKLAALNKSYLDLIGFVSHELKGVLSGAILNAYAVRDGFLGMINFKQRKALDSVTRSLDYLAALVKNFLNLSRIEKGELNIHKTEILLKEDVISEACDTFAKQAEEKQMTISNLIGPNQQVYADCDMLKIVANNLVNNALKYGRPKGRVIISGKKNPSGFQVEVYNDGVPLDESDKEKLFKRFSRILRPQMQREKGTGLGLFISKEIVEKHGGKMWVEPKEEGNSFLFTIAKEE
ncbi:MAG: cache domain-containing protein [Candidatus Omnitrophica bacterium]|nr:cache domain-containing protein [Candidatus Omnitrophota bacterium]